jgi:hypothetical protein
MIIRSVADHDYHLILTIAIVGANAYQRQISYFRTPLGRSRVFQTCEPSLVCTAELVESRP